MFTISVAIIDIDVLSLNIKHAST